MAMGFLESDVISALQKIFATDDSRVKVGIGDDAAVLTTSTQTLMSSDMAVEDVHFRIEWSSAFDIGRKITAANVADILAMGGSCDFLTASVALTGKESLTWVEDLARGMKYEADLAQSHIVGGDIARGEKVVISMTALGHTSRPILRSGAQVGDSIFISSLPGWSAAGLELHSRNVELQSSSAIKALAEFSAPSIDYAIDFSRASAMVDLSDSLLVQGGQLADASGVCLYLDEDLIEHAPEFSELASLAQELDIDIFRFIYAGGEDHVLLATGVDLPGIKIGSVVGGAGITGVKSKVAPVSWSHFGKDM
jgi:thiamine-monophosphate kinase